VLEFEKLYLAVRQKEKRLYSDEEVMQLPYVHPKHIHHKEWLIRQSSFEKLIEYLRQRQKPLKILEVGCGNGWMSNKLAEGGFTTIGVDVNSFEIEQAKRVFANNKAVNFVYGNILKENLCKDEKFDVIVLAASVQYFSDLGPLLNYLLSLLNSEGEIQVIDSNFYSEKQAQKAKQRSLNYYRTMGFGEMAKHYYHHLWDSLVPFKYSIQDGSGKFMRLLKGTLHKFPWIIIKK
jgi:ubiquinone/menaquinone biosynthesis C-methylase UbiE